jgi:hypothetical protein
MFKFKKGKIISSKRLLPQFSTFGEGTKDFYENQS